MFPGILLFNPSLLQILFPTVAISKECSFSRTQPQISLILTRCPGVLFHTDTSRSPDQHCPLFHFWLFLSEAGNSPSEPLITPQTLLAHFFPPPLYITTFSSSHGAPFSLYCCEKHCKKTQIRESKWFVPACTLLCTLLKEVKSRLKQKTEAEPTEGSCLLVLKDSCSE